MAGEVHQAFGRGGKLSLWLPLHGADTGSPKDGYGTNHDLVEAEYTRPNVNFMDLKKLGFIC
jgi:hypothetical protein